MKNTIDTLKTQIEDKQEYASSLETQVNELLAQNMELNATLEGLQVEQTKLREQMDKADRKNHDDQCIISELKSKYEETRVELNESSNRVPELLTEIEAAKAQLKENDGCINRLKEELRASQEAELRVQNSMKSLEGSIEEEKSSLKESFKKEKQEAVASLETDLREARERFETLESSSKTLFETLEVTSFEEAESKLQKLYALKEETKDLASRMEAQAASFEEKLSSAMNEKDFKIEKLDSEINRLTGLNAELSQEKERAIGEAKASHTKWESCMEDLVGLKDRIQTLQTELAEIRENNIQSSKESEEILKERCSKLEQELRRSKRREEKLQAMQYRLREDIKQAGGSLDKFERLRDVRSLEYEMDRAKNKYEKEIASLHRALKEAQACKGTSARQPLIDKENNPLCHH